MDGNFLKNLRCSECRSTLKKEDSFLVCLECRKQYKIVNGIPDFRQKDEYWCNISREKMQELNRSARESKDWLSSARKLAPKYLDHFVSFYRADCQFLWPATKDSKILDAGSMWGGITIPASQYNGEVYAVDKTIETLEFLDIRAEQMNIKNIYPAAASLRSLPFPDNFFDMAILSGVLEWVALEEDITLEKQWKGTGSGLKIKQRKKYAETPGQMQLKVLQEIRRVLKPEGSLYLAIENRIGYIYLAGWPDEHMNLPFIGLLPRFLANFTAKLLLGSEYRTYVYTISGYKSLLKKAGFNSTDFYGVFNNYIKPIQAIPLELIGGLKKKMFADAKWQLKLLSIFIPSGFLKHLPPSIICFASKGQKPANEPRLKQIFRKAGLISDDDREFRAVKWNSRLDNSLPANYLVYTDTSKTPAYFCKICRDKNLTDAIKDEANNLELVNHTLKGTRLESNFPKLIYFGAIDGITVLITTYLSGDPIGFFFLYKYKNSNLPFNKFATKKWLNKIDPVMKKSIDILVDFQKQSSKERINASSYFDIQLDAYLERINKNFKIDGETLKLIKMLSEKIKLFNNVNIPLCLEHGDYDICNILMARDKINIVDFEHTEPNRPPFFDLATLLFDPLLIQWVKIGKGKKLKEFADEYGWSEKINEWVKYYSEISGMPMDILKFLPALSALEQNAKNYPSSRDPYTYLMYGEDIFKRMLQWEL